MSLWDAFADAGPLVQTIAGVLLTFAAYGGLALVRGARARIDRALPPGL